MEKSFLLHLFLLILHIELYQAHLKDSLDLSINLRKNQTGHVVTKWTLTEGSLQAPQNINVDLRTSITEQDGMQYLHLHGYIAVPPPKPEGYELFQGVGYYRFYPDGAQSFYDASSICTQDGGHLAIINSEAESKVLSTIFARYQRAKEWAWIGFNDLDVEGQYVTIFGVPLDQTGFTRWYPGTPDNQQGEDCGSVHRSGVLNDFCCDNCGTNPFFCEYDLTWGES